MYSCVEPFHQSIYGLKLVEKVFDNCQYCTQYGEFLLSSTCCDIPGSPDKTLTIITQNDCVPYVNESQKKLGESTKRLVSGQVFLAELP
jgi:hypothetical protein